MSLTSKSLRKNPKAPDLIFEDGEHVRLPVRGREVAADVANQQRERTDDPASWLGDGAAAHELVTDPYTCHVTIVTRCGCLGTLSKRVISAAVTTSKIQ